MNYRYEHYMSISHMALIANMVQVQTISFDSFKNEITKIFPEK